MNVTYQKPVSEEELNERSKDLGAARVTLEALENNIKHENYFSAYDGATCTEAQSKSLDMTVASLAGTGEAAGEAQVPESLRLLTFCVLTLRNGFTVTGQSACADPKNFDQEIGRKIARGDAIRQVWGLMGYELRSRLTHIEGFTEEQLGEALTRLLAHSMGNPEVLRPQDSETIINFVESQGAQ
jgi:hypothetical protein